VVDRQPGIVAEIGSAAAVDELLLEAEDAAARLIPVASDLVLCEGNRRQRRGNCSEEKTRTDDAVFGFHTLRTPAGETSRAARPSSTGSGSTSSRRAHASTNFLRRTAS